MLPRLTPPAPRSTVLVNSADGETLAVHDFGGEGPDLLLCHGNGLNAGMWRAALPHLVDRFHCWGLDLRGHGANRPESVTYDVNRDRFAEDVFAAMDHIAANGGAAPAFYAAHSLGGAAGVHAARREPQRFRGLWLFEPVVVSDDFVRPGPPSFLIEASRRRRMEFGSAEEAFENFCSKPPFNTCDPEAVRGYVEIGVRLIGEGPAVRLSCEGENEARVFGSGQPLDFSTLAAITCPTVIARGENTGDAHAIPAAMAEPISKAIPGATLIEFSGLTHFGPMEAPAEIAASIIATFLG